MLVRFLNDLPQCLTLKGGAIKKSTQVPTYKFKRPYMHKKPETTAEFSPMSVQIDKCEKCVKSSHLSDNVVKKIGSK